jgi:hypothetical protein
MQPFIQKLFQVVVAGELGHLAALFVEPHPAAALLDVVILDLHGYGRASKRDIIQMLPVFSLSTIAIRPPAVDQPSC